MPTHLPVLHGYRDRSQSFILHHPIFTIAGAATPCLLEDIDILADAPLKRPLDRWSALVQGPHLENAEPNHGTLQQKEFLTDDFRINSFKVTTHLMRKSLGGHLD